jgi:hypothetical protein
VKIILCSLLNIDQYTLKKDLLSFSFASRYSKSFNSKSSNLFSSGFLFSKGFEFCFLNSPMVLVLELLMIKTLLSTIDKLFIVLILVLFFLFFLIIFFCLGGNKGLCAFSLFL